MALIEFEDYPNTDTPLNAENLNNNFNDIIDRIKNSDSDSDEEVFSCNMMNIKLNQIIESGSNQNGHYIKYADGTMICRGVAGPYTTNAGTGQSSDVTLPASFINTSYHVILQLINGQAYWASISTAASVVSNTTFKVSTWNSSNNSSAVNSNQNFAYIAIGRWKL